MGCPNVRPGLVPNASLQVPEDQRQATPVEAEPVNAHAPAPSRTAPLTWGKPGCAAIVAAVDGAGLVDDHQSVGVSRSGGKGGDRGVARP